MLHTIKNISKFVISFIVSACLFDVFLILTEAIQLQIYEPDSQLGRVFIKNSNYLMTTEGFAMGSINGGGYIGPDYKTEKDSGKIRIALLGDSYVEGFQNFDRNHFRAVIEKELKERYNIDAEVLNFGRFGFNLNNNYVLNENFVSKYDPDITLFFLSNEDLYDTLSMDNMPQPIIMNDSIQIAYNNIPKSRMPWFLNRFELSKSLPSVMMIRNSMTLSKKRLPYILLDKLGVFFDSSSDPEEIYLKDSIPLLNKRLIEKLAKNTSNIIVLRDLRTPHDSALLQIDATGLNYINLSPLLNSTNPNKFYFIAQNGEAGHWNLTAHQTIGEFLAAKISFFIKK